MGNSSAKIQAAPKQEKTDPFKNVDMFVEDSLKLLDQEHPACSSHLREIRKELVHRATGGELLRVSLSLKNDPKTLLPCYVLDDDQTSKEDDIYPYCLTMQTLVYEACMRGFITNAEEMFTFIEKKFMDEGDKRFFSFLVLAGEDKYTQIVNSTYNRLKCLLKIRAGASRV